MNYTVRSLQKYGEFIYQKYLYKRYLEGRDIKLMLYARIFKVSEIHW